MNDFVSIKQLPPPPDNCIGWPWTEETPTLPEMMPDGGAWPRITVVTPSFNQGQFIEETIRSVLLQGYPNLEYAVIDGGSTDESVEIIKKYEPWLTFWVSEKDRGQSHAINKGLERCTGEIFNWINSDDTLLPHALERIALLCAGRDAVGAAVVNFRGEDEEMVVNANLTAMGLMRIDPEIVFHQPGLWLRPALIAECGGIDERFHFVFDWDLTIRYLHRHPEIAYLPSVVARFRLHEESKTVSAQVKFEEERVLVLDKLQRLQGFEPLHQVCSYHFRLALWWGIMNAAIRERREPPCREALRLAWMTCHDPAIRWSRKTAGCIRRLLLRRP